MRAKLDWTRTNEGWVALARGHRLKVFKLHSDAGLVYCPSVDHRSPQPAQTFTYHLAAMIAAEKFFKERYA